MRDNYNYPLGADNESAPWNQVEPAPKKVEVTISLTISKTVEVEVDDYTMEESTDEEGIVTPIYNFSECDLYAATKDQLPKCEGWCIDDYQVILEE